MVQTQNMTVEEFEQFILRPDNVDRLFEYIGGDAVEVVTNYYCSLVALRIATRISSYVEIHNLGYVSGEAGGYQVVGQRYMPDVGFISKKKQPEPLHDTFNPRPPDLAVEVLSPTDKPGKVRTKIANYLLAGTAVWIIDPDEKEVEIYAPGQTAQTLGLDGTLDGGDVLPGFRLAVKDIFDL